MRFQKSQLTEARHGCLPFASTSTRKAHAREINKKAGSISNNWEQQKKNGRLAPARAALGRAALRLHQA
jgi:hypothetical protein